MKLLLHLCCGPCATAIIKDLQQRGLAVTAFFYNPNIQPLSERRARFASLEKHLAKIKVPLLSVDQDEQTFLATIKNTPHRPQRCLACYRLRLEAAAKVAAEQRFDYFTTTLLSSPHQDIAAIREIGDELARKYKIRFYAPDSGRKKFKGFRPLFTASRQLAKQEHLYEQKYCGCLYSFAESSKLKAQSSKEVQGSKSKTII